MVSCRWFALESTILKSNPGPWEGNAGLQQVWKVTRSVVDGAWLMLRAVT